jgi:Asp-tRNA(Asn)/Glu-tRNA(Gln) amidotransferase A subunit family amidase
VRAGSTRSSRRTTARGPRSPPPGAPAARSPTGRKQARGKGGGPLAGVPVAVGDDVADLALPTTAGSRVLAGYVSPYEATAVRRLLDAGAVVVGKTNVDEFGMGWGTETSAYGPTANPAARAHTPAARPAGRRPPWHPAPSAPR